MNTATTTRPANLEHGTIRVLCVDDNRDLADSYHLMLDLYGFDVQTFYNGFDAVESVKRDRPDICFIDLQMPGMAGDEVARRILAMHPDRPPILIAVTAMSGDLDRVLTQVAGFRRHLVKPVDPSDLMAIIETELGDQRIF